MYYMYLVADTFKRIKILIYLYFFFLLIYISFTRFQETSLLASSLRARFNTNHYIHMALILRTNLLFLNAFW